MHPVYEIKDLAFIMLQALETQAFSIYSMGRHQMRPIFVRQTHERMEELLQQIDKLEKKYLKEKEDEFQSEERADHSIVTKAQIQDIFTEIRNKTTIVQNRLKSSLG
jgi:hypothetical protein